MPLPNLDHMTMKVVFGFCAYFAGAMCVDRFGILPYLDAHPFWVWLHTWRNNIGIVVCCGVCLIVFFFL